MYERFSITLCAYKQIGQGGVDVGERGRRVHRRKRQCDTSTGQKNIMALMSSGDCKLKLNWSQSTLE